MRRIDHVVYAVRDLDAVAARWESVHGLRSVAGGMHPRWGTANRIVPLGADHLELISIVDPRDRRSDRPRSDPEGTPREGRPLVLGLRGGRRH